MDRNTFGKESQLGAKGSKRSIPAGLMEGLVDIVDHKGDPQFLFKRGKDLVVQTEEEKGDELYVSPHCDHMPWLLPGLTKSSDTIRRIVMLPFI